MGCEGWQAWGFLLVFLSQRLPAAPSAVFLFLCLHLLTDLAELGQGDLQVLLGRDGVEGN